MAFFRRQSHAYSISNGLLAAIDVKDNPLNFEEELKIK
jgi:hypothetical protein